MTNISLLSTGEQRTGNLLIFCNTGNMYYMNVSDTKNSSCIFIKKIDNFKPSEGGQNIDGLYFSTLHEGVTNKELIDWAQHVYNNLPKCDKCGELIEEKHTLLDFPDEEFCSQYCAEEWYNEQNKLQEELI